MIAKELQSGHKANGLIDYVFKGREEAHVDKGAEVLANSDELVVPFHMDDKDGIEYIIKQFNKRTSGYLKDNPENKGGLLGHQILSFTKEDEEKLGEDGIKKVLGDFIELSKLDKTQYIAVSHQDTKNKHIHIVYSKVQNDGRKENEWRRKNKTVERGVALALRNDLTLIKDQKKIADTKGVYYIRSKDKDIKDLRREGFGMGEAHNLHHLNKLRTKKGLQAISPDVKGTITFDKKTYRMEDMNTVFFMNREHFHMKTFHVKETQKNYLTDFLKIDTFMSNKLKLDISSMKPIVAISNVAESKTADKTSSVGVSRRKRRGASYKLKQAVKLRKWKAQNKGQGL